MSSVTFLAFYYLFWHLGEKKNSFSLLYEGYNRHPSCSKYLLDQEDFKLREGCHCGSFVWLNFQPQGAFPHGWLQSCTPAIVLGFNCALTSVESLKCERVNMNSHLAPFHWYNVLSYLRHFCWSCVSANLLTECGQTKFRYLAFYSFCTAEVIDCPYKWSRETGTALYYNRGSLGNLHILYLMVSCSRSWITITILFKTNENSVTIHWLLKSIFVKHNRGISVYGAGLHVCVHL